MNGKRPEQSNNRIASRPTAAKPVTVSPDANAFDGLVEAKATGLGLVIDRLCRLGVHHLAVLLTMAVLSYIAYLVVVAGNALTGLGLSGLLSISLLAVGFGVTVLYLAGTIDATHREESADSPSQP